MTGKTHILGGIAASLAYAHIANEDPMILVGAGIVGALLPDICHSGSKLGRKLPLLSKIINTLFGHRTFTHSILFLVLIASLMNAFFPNDVVKTGILVGMVSHYILDMATRNGIKLFFPLNLTVRFPVTTRTGSKVEGIVFSLLTLISFYYGFQVLGFYL
ncbi:metal-dependent hydrolase [Sporosarcina pasteurii]|uniref:Inner membrane protein ydjM n=1 Tax=Sporosarcina pasteurii TaxID=1474 RepID=A0A380BI81_SPOPA|nr:metal-dependent hydrolase [Sporosarcina pasteurii]MDS9470739.1 metal-dependent hydrolase [Sporosarcina pasteurii]QBQ05584.1 metal-dependent hydrolase [Sporosarcina pasteurii]SUJ01765.1 Inner membrane protein ydjM [Sporosarcina pasteurii]